MADLLERLLVDGGGAFSESADGEVAAEALSRRWQQVTEAVADFASLLAGVPGWREIPPEDLDDHHRRLPGDPAGTAGRLSAATGLGLDVASFLLVHTHGPFYQARALAAGPLDTSLWTGGRCPQCGGRPHYGLLAGQEAARVLECWLCGTRWRYPRLQCPYCENSRQDTLGYFTLPEEPGIRVCFCRSCDCYLKVYDSQHLAEVEVDLRILNFATLAHDVAAVQQGFRPGSGLILASTGSTDEIREER
ncbi:MAG: formate dehydrogenase accessory protein FdhE [bacterium]|nr:formate dehydrogenase accessory protein FdhE [bacterium]